MKELFTERTICDKTWMQPQHPTKQESITLMEAHKFAQDKKIQEPTFSMQP
jgi:hypothetical protein